MNRSLAKEENMCDDEKAHFGFPGISGKSANEGYKNPECPHKVSGNLTMKQSP